MNTNQSSDTRDGARGVLVSGLWVGEIFPELAELCVRSFLDHGHQFQLFTYRDYPNIPAGTHVRDASGIIPRETIYRHGESGSLAPFSDWFRYKLLYEEGGMWVDMDMVCLSDRIPTVQPWFARQTDDTVAIGVLSFPAGDPLIKNMLDVCNDPAAIVPWYDDGETTVKRNWAANGSTIASRRINASWYNGGPETFTRALSHYGLLDKAAHAASIYPVFYTCWRNLFNGIYRLEDPLFSRSWGIHMWGEMLRREPDAMNNLARNSIVRSLMERHGMSSPSSSTPLEKRKKKSRVVVGICSALACKERREGVRKTWLAEKVEGVDCFFFLGRKSPMENEPDVVTLDVPDGYIELPEKIMAFFRYALENYDFEWLFKCDDDTYLDQERLLTLLNEEADLIGNPTPAEEKTPSGGAGYLLTHEMVEKIVRDNAIPDKGYEDVLIGRKALELGARYHHTSRLGFDTRFCPEPDNDTVSSHWCSPRHMEAIHRMRHAGEFCEFNASHIHWKDTLRFYSNGVFRRKNTGCYGFWSLSDEEKLALQWIDWDPCELKPCEEGYVSGKFVIHELSPFKLLSMQKPKERPFS